MTFEKGIFKYLAEKLGKLKVPEDSLIKKIDTIKKNTEISETNTQSSVDISDQLKKSQEEMVKKVEELVNSKTDSIKSNADAVKNMEFQLAKMEQIVSASKKSSDELKERLDKIDETILELSSLYEVVSSTVNPFVGDSDTGSAKKIAEFEKKIEELSHKPQEMPAGVIEDFDNKYKVLQKNIEELKKIIAGNSIQEDAIVEKVAGIVAERMMPILEQSVQAIPEPPVSPQGKDPVAQEAPKKAAQTSAQPAAQPQKAPEVRRYEIDDTGVRLPFLDNRPETSIFLLNWIEFLMEKVGRNNLVNVLEYYVEIGWISEEVSSKMMTYASGIDYYMEKPTWKLLPEDHTKSLLFIEQLGGRKVDKNILAKLQRDVDKVIRGSEFLIV